MNILVTGGSGLFGRKTALHLLRDPEIASVTSMDVAPPPDWFLKSVGKYKDRFRYVRGDVSRLEDFLNVMKDRSIEAVINWAFLMVTPDMKIEPRVLTNVNVLGMSNAFEAARLMGARRVVYASSETVYGSQDMYGERDVTEDDQTNPRHSYAICKLYAEIMAEQYTRLHGMSFTGLRPTIGYGHGGRSPAHYWSDMVSLAAVGKPFSMEGDGNGLASLVSADDLAAFTRVLVKAPSSPHPVYNIGGPPTSPREMAAAIHKYLPDAEISFGTRPMTDPTGRDSLPWRVSMKRAMDDFGFSCMPLEEGVLVHINDARAEAGLKPLKA